MTNNCFIKLITCVSFILLNLGEVGAQISANLSNLVEGEIASGSNHTIVLNIINAGQDTVRVQYSTVIPNPLRALLFSNSVVLLPETTKNVLIPISVPANTYAGNFELGFVVRSNGVEITTLTTTFKVPRRTEIDIDLITRPPYARSDDTIRAKFMVNNTGNDKEYLTFFSRNCKIIGVSAMSIPADSTIFMDVEMIPDVALYRVEDRALDLSCQILSNDNVVSDQEIIRIYPIKTQKIDPYFRYPITFNTNYNVRTTNKEVTLEAMQYQITGKGTFDVKKKHNFLFDYRGPGSIRVTRVGNFAQKYAQYYNKKLNVFLGEKTYGLSPLTESFRFGTGIDIIATPSPKWTLSAYYNKPLLMPDIKDQIAGYVQFQSLKKYTYRLNVVRNDMSVGNNLSLASLQCAWTDFNDWALSTEVSRSLGAGKHGNAYSYAGNVAVKGFKFSSTGLYAEKDFKGYYANSMYVNGNIGYNLKRIGFQIGGNFNDENPNLDTVFSAAPYSILLNGGIIGRFSKAWDMQLMALYRQKIDRLSNKRFDYEERRLRYSTTYRLGFWRARFLAEGGYTKNLLISNPEFQTRFGYDAQIQISYAPRGKISLNVFSQYLSNTRFTTNRVSYILYGADITYKIHRKLVFSTEFQNNYLIEDLYNDRNLINGKLNYNFAINHHLALYGNYGILHQSPVRHDFYYSVSYAFKLGVPLKKTIDLGSLSGTISNQGVESISKIVLLMDGQLATTDELGRFKFNNLKPGIHQLFIDKRSIGVRDMPNVKLPIEVEIFPDKTSTINFALTRSGAVKGNVEMAKIKMIQSSKEKIVLPRIIVEIFNDEESHLTQADPNGNFLFGTLRPGTWTVRLVPTYWKDQFIVRIGETEAVVLPDGEVEVHLLIEPKVRQIKFLNPSSTIKVGGK